jgi:hypothetical protein
VFKEEIVNGKKEREKKKSGHVMGFGGGVFGGFCVTPLPPLQQVLLTLDFANGNERVNPYPQDWSAGNIYNTEIDTDRNCYSGKKKNSLLSIIPVF